VPTAFFMVDLKGRYNVLLGWYWIHTNEFVSSTLHQCVIKWIGDAVELVQADEEACVAVAETQVDILGGKIECLSGKELMWYNYIGVGKDGFVPISVKLSIEEKPWPCFPNLSKSSTTPIASFVYERYSAVHQLNHLRSLLTDIIYQRSWPEVIMVFLSINYPCVNFNFLENQKPARIHNTFNFRLV
jgi:hypothetical protein